MTRGDMRNDLEAVYRALARQIWVGLLVMFVAFTVVILLTGCEATIYKSTTRTVLAGSFWSGFNVSAKSAVGEVCLGCLDGKKKRDEREQPSTDEES